MIDSVAVPFSISSFTFYAVTDACILSIIVVAVFSLKSFYILDKRFVFFGLQRSDITLDTCYHSNDVISTYCIDFLCLCFTHKFD